MFADPYVKINLLYHGQRMCKWKTSVKKSTTNPIFNELYEIDISTMSVEEIQFEVLVMSYDRLGHNYQVGSVAFGDAVAHVSGRSHWKRVMIDTSTEISRWHPLVSTQCGLSSRISTPLAAPVRRATMPIHGCFKGSDMQRQ